MHIAKPTAGFSQFQYLGNKQYRRIVRRSGRRGKLSVKNSIGIFHALQRPMKYLKNIKPFTNLVLLAFIVGSVALVTGCENNDTPGDELEEAGESLTDAAEEAGEGAKDAVEEAGDEIEDAADDMD